MRECKIYKFTIKGNQNDPDGNPLPFVRALNYAPRAADRKYFEWHEYIRATVKDHCTPIPDDYEVIKRGAHFVYYPFKLEKHIASVAMSIKWHNNLHGDADNVFKGILDALFRNDKNVVAGSFESSHDPDKKGSVDVTVKICPFKHWKLGHK